MRLTRPVAYGERGMVATPHYLASTAALDVLRDGGNAVDAALSAAATLGSVLPHMTGIGGDAFWLIYDAGTNTLAGINGSGTVSRNLGLEAYAGQAEIPMRGPRAAITVPGAVDSWRLAHGRFGRLPLARLLEPAIEYARDGSPVSAGLSGWIAASAGPLSDDPGAASVFLEGGTPLAEAARLNQPALARTLAALAQNGPRHFYEATARSIAAYLGAHGGVLDAEDFAAYEARWVDPISVRYRDCTAYQLPPPSQGLAGLLILNALSELDVTALGNGTAAYFDALIRAIRWAFHHRDIWLTDPTFLDIPVQALLSQKTGHPERALEGAASGPRRSGDDTVFVATADADGNAVGLVQSLYFDFGAAVLDPDSGVLLQNRGASFSLDPRHPNVLAAGKQSASTLMAGMLFRDGLPYLVHGTQGGEGQAQTNASVVTRVVDFGCDAQQAVEAPRLLSGRSWGDAATQLLVETQGSDDAIADLARLGHQPQPMPWPHPRMGTAQAIRLKGPGREFHEGGADPRGEGLALGF